MWLVVDKFNKIKGQDSKKIKALEKAGVFEPRSTVGKLQDGSFAEFSRINKEYTTTYNTFGNKTRITEKMAVRTYVLVQLPLLLPVGEIATYTRNYSKKIGQIVNLFEGLRLFSDDELLSLGKLVAPSDNAVKCFRKRTEIHYYCKRDFLEQAVRRAYRIGDEEAKTRITNLIMERSDSTLLPICN